MDDYLTVTINQTIHRQLCELADQTGETIEEVVERAVWNHGKERFRTDYHAAYSTIQADPSKIASLEKEVSAWDATLADGLIDP